MSKKARKHLFPYCKGYDLCFCICENTGLLNQSDTEVKSMRESRTIVGRNFVYAKKSVYNIFYIIILLSLGCGFDLKITCFYQTSRYYLFKSIFEYGPDPKLLRYRAREYTPQKPADMAKPNTKFHSSLGYRSAMVIPAKQKVSLGLPLPILDRISPACAWYTPSFILSPT